MGGVIKSKKCKRCYRRFKGNKDICESCLRIDSTIYAKLRDKKWLKREYYSLKSSTLVAKIIGCSGMVVRTWLKKHKIKMLRTQSQETIEKIRSVRRSTVGLKYPLLSTYPLSKSV